MADISVRELLRGYASSGDEDYVLRAGPRGRLGASRSIKLVGPGVRLRSVLDAYVATPLPEPTSISRFNHIDPSPKTAGAPFTFVRDFIQG
jgi:hypothetical protein